MIIGGKLNFLTEITHTCFGGILHNWTRPQPEKMFRPLNFVLWHIGRVIHAPCPSDKWVCARVWRIYSNIRIFEYFWYEYLFGHSFASFFVYEYIRIFVRIKILLRIYSDIRSYQNFDTNIFGHSFVFLRIYSNISTYSFC